MEKTSDEELMSRYQRGDVEAFDRLYGRYRGPLYRYIKRQCGDASIAEELYQEVWLKVVRSRNQWRSGGGVRAWLFRIAHNQLVDYWRKTRQADRSSEEDSGSVVAIDRALPEGLLLIKECIERLFKLLADLSEPQRSAFLLKEEAGLTLAQIAEVTGSGRETVKSRLRYAIGRLRLGLEGCDE